MEHATMGKVLVTAKIENLHDLYRATDEGQTPVPVRQVEVDNALVDAGATMLSLPQRLIGALGLQQSRSRKVRTVAGVVDCAIYEAVRLTIQGRDCTVDVAAIPDDCPPLVGQIPLEALDFVVDPVGQRLIGNPEHGGEHMLDIF